MIVPRQEKEVWDSSGNEKEERGHRNTADVLLFSLRQEAFLAAGQHASVVQDELERPLPVLMEKAAGNSYLGLFSDIPLLADKHQASLAEITDDPGHLSLKLLGSE